MKKVGIITLHRVVNYGSVLQTYALQEKIKELGYDVEIIDYYPKRLHMIGMLKRIKEKGGKLNKSLFLRTIARIIIFPSYIIRFDVFKKFLSKYINMTPTIYYKEEELIKEKFEYNIYCTGSDQVWNSDWNEKVERPFFLDFAPEDSKKIAYAASFGKKQLRSEEINETKKLLKRYDSISLREASGVEIVKSLELKGINVVDPTLLLDGNEWRRMKSKKYSNDKYILVYNLNRNKKIDEYARKLSEKTGLKVRFLSYQLHEFYKKGKISCNPCVEDFLSLIDNSQYVITDSFHATAFSINFNKEFIIIYPEKFSTRLQNLLEINNLQDRVVKKENDLTIIDKKINYMSINKIMEGERKKSINWLSESLS